MHLYDFPENHFPVLLEPLSTCKIECCWLWQSSEQHCIVGGFLLLESDDFRDRCLKTFHQTQWCRTTAHNKNPHYPYESEYDVCEEFFQAYDKKAYCLFFIRQRFEHYVFIRFHKNIIADIVSA